MNLEQKIDRVLTEYNFDRISFDEAKKELLNLHSVVWRSEQLVCECSPNTRFFNLKTGKCLDCQKKVEF